MEDSEILKRVINNTDLEAFTNLIEKYQKMVVTTCRNFVSNYADAEDVAQDVFIELYESLPSFRNESKLSTWIYRIAVNKSLNFVKKRKRELLFSSFSKRGNAHHNPIIEGSDQSDEADFRIAKQEQLKILRQAINKLPENQKIAIILNKYQELSYKEVADIMGVSLSSVESLIFRSKINLQKYLNNELRKK